MEGRLRQSYLKFDDMVDWSTIKPGPSSRRSRQFLLEFPSRRRAIGTGDRQQQDRGELRSKILHPDAVEHAKTLFSVVSPSDPEVKNWRENASSIIIRGSYVTAHDISSAPNLIAIGKHGVGIDKIDQAACAKRGIKILNTPGANARDVAELVVSLTMSLARSIRSITTRQMTAPVPKETCTGLTLHRKTIGIIGMGNIGRTVAEIFHRGFDAELIAFDAFIPDDAWPHLPHKRAQSIQEVIAAADVLTLHVPLTDETRNMLSYKQLPTVSRR